MVHITTFDPDGRVIRSAQKAAMMRYRSMLLRTIYTLVAAPLLLAGTVDEKQTVEVDLFSLYEEHPVS